MKKRTSSNLLLNLTDFLDNNGIEFDLFKSSFLRVDNLRDDFNFLIGMIGEGGEVIEVEVGVEVLLIRVDVDSVKVSVEKFDGIGEERDDDEESLLILILILVLLLLLLLLLALMLMEDDDDEEEDEGSKMMVFRELLELLSSKGW